MKKGADRQIVAAKIAEIESEMIRVGLWQPEHLGEEQYNFHQAFALDTITFTQWLQFIFIPRVRELLAAEDEFLTKSEVGLQAFREFLMWPAYREIETERLLNLLNEFDTLFEAS
jgi:uncharacterized protein YqcC (DUF446 family)